MTDVLDCSAALEVIIITSMRAMKNMSSNVGISLLPSSFLPIQNGLIQMGLMVRPVIGSLNGSVARRM
ncbi:hypothetical protein D3C81_2092160 [compost metagenome]